jgi:hypothetical protein
MKLHIIQPLCLALLLVPTAVLADYQDDIGYRALEAGHRLISRGAGLKVGQVEAQIENAYMPDRLNLAFAGKLFWPPSVTAVSGHATMVGELFYGHDGIAPDTSLINVYDSGAFLIGPKGLRVGQHQPPAKLNVSVLNNSWIAAFNSDSQNVEAIRRLDLVIKRDDILEVSSVDNGSGSAYPKLLATAYNGVAVGILAGSSGGPITFDSRGPRAKPDIVVPVNTTSEAAGTVSGAAALIRSEAKARQMNVNELTTKALLMAGAERPEDWQRGAPGASDDVKVPLDYGYGAGSLRVDHSFDILVAGQHPFGGSDTGWDAGMAKKKSKIYQFSVVDGGSGEGEDHQAFTAMLTWNREIKRSVRGTYGSSLANMQLSLLTKSGRKWARVSQSDSDFDNLESITLDDLPAGTYRLAVRSDRPEPFSLAWLTAKAEDHHEGDGSNGGPGSGSSTLLSIDGNLSVGEIVATAVPEPTMIALLIPAVGMLAARRTKKAAPKSARLP